MKKLFVVPEEPELKMKYLQLIIAAGNACLGIQENWCYADDETISLFYDLYELIDELYKDETPKNDKRRLRICLFLYCHLYESKLIPRMLHNLLTLQKDGSYNERPFPRRNENQERSISYKMKDIYNLNSELGYEEYNLPLSEIFNDSIRNSFFHSDYNFNDNGLVINCNRNARLEIINYKDFSYYALLMFNYFGLFLSTWNDAKKNFPDDYSFTLYGQTVKIIKDSSGMICGIKMGYNI